MYPCSTLPQPATITVPVVILAVVLIPVSWGFTSADVSQLLEEA